jgi:hypothetical protein
MQSPNPRIIPRRKVGNAMAKTTSILFLATLVTMAVAASVGAEEPEEETCNALFVLSAQDVSMDANTLTMKGTSPAVIYFCDRPVRFAGHLSVEKFLSSVSKGEDSFAADPPNSFYSRSQRLARIPRLIPTPAGAPRCPIWTPRTPIRSGPRPKPPRRRRRR